MSNGDLKLVWSDTDLAADLAIALNDFERDEGLRTAVLLSLFLDRRADDGDELLDANADRRGWWADEFADADGDKIGSRLWLLSRAKPAEWISQAPEYGKEALLWLVEDKVAERVEVVASVLGNARGLDVDVYKPQQKQPTRFKFEDVWRAEASLIVEAA